MNGSKLIDLRDCQHPEYQQIYQDMERVQWQTHGILARLLFKTFGKTHKLKSIWARQWEYPWAVLNANLRPGLIVLDAGCGASPLLPYVAWRYEDLSLYGVDKGEDAESTKTKTWKLRLLKAIGYVPVAGFHPDIDRRIHFRLGAAQK
jgi:2-polyprenyl-3-methyl-5-hydroxy-6-metoxy-1,4-benzoquinol methylase